MGTRGDLVVQITGHSSMLNIYTISHMRNVDNKRLFFRFYLRLYTRLRRHARDLRKENMLEKYTDRNLKE